MQFIKVTDFSNKITFINANHIFSIEPTIVNEGEESALIRFVGENAPFRIVKESPDDLLKQLNMTSSISNVIIDHKAQIEKMQNAIKNGAQS